MEKARWDTLRASARAEVLRLVAEHEKYERSIRRVADAGGRARNMAKMSWQGSGRYAPPRCGECGYESRALSSTCELCGEVLHAGS